LNVVIVIGIASIGVKAAAAIIAAILLFETVKA
jgi:hypothetical protein